MRQLYIVNATQVVTSDAHPEGVYSVVRGYPKTFDSKNYGNDIDKTQRRANGDASEVWGAMCKNDTRQMQTVTDAASSSDHASRFYHGLRTDLYVFAENGTGYRRTGADDNMIEQNTAANRCGCRNKTFPSDRTVCNVHRQLRMQTLGMHPWYSAGTDSQRTCQI